MSERECGRRNKGHRPPFWVILNYILFYHTINFFFPFDGRGVGIL